MEAPIRYGTSIQGLSHEIIKIRAVEGGGYSTGDGGPMRSAGGGGGRGRGRGGPYEVRYIYTGTVS